MRFIEIYLITFAMAAHSSSSQVLQLFIINYQLSFQSVSVSFLLLFSFVLLLFLLRAKAHCVPFKVRKQ